MEVGSCEYYADFLECVQEEAKGYGLYSVSIISGYDPLSDSTETHYSVSGDRNAIIGMLTTTLRALTERMEYSEVFDEGDEGEMA